MPLNTSPLIIGSQAWFIREGTAFTLPSAGTAGAAALPAANDPLWDTTTDVTLIGNIESSTDETSTEEKKVYGPSPGHLEVIAAVQTKFDRMLRFTVVDFGPLALELMTRSGALTQASSTFTPFASPVKRGWLKVQRYDQADALVYTERIWGILEIDGAVTFGDDFVKPSFVFKVQRNALAGGTLP